MKRLLTLLLVLTTGGYALADTFEQIELIPGNILYSIEQTAGYESNTLNSPIGECIKLYRNLKNTQKKSIEAFHSPFQNALENTKETISFSKNKFTSIESIHRKYAYKNLEDIESGVTLLKDWALEETVTGRAKILRLIYATVKLQEITTIIKKENQKWAFSLRPNSLWQKLSVKFPSEVFKKYPNDSIDGLLISVLDHKGQFKKYDKLAMIINSPFACPSTEFYSNNPSIKPSIYDYSSIHNNLNGKDLDEWFEKNSNLSPSEDKPFTSSKIQLPAYDYQNKINELTGSSKPNDILLLALLKHTFETGNDIGEIVEMLNSIEGKLESSHPANDFKPDSNYDGTNDSMINYLRHYSQNGLGGAAYFTIPCGVLIEKPELLPAISPYYGGNRDNFLPRHDCNENNYPLPKSVETYLQLVDEPQNGWLDSHQGTMRYAHYKLLNQQNLTIRVFPKQLIETNEKRSHQFPYETWSYLNIENRNVYETLKAAYLTAKKDLTHHYITNFSLSKNEAVDAAEAALWLTVREVHWGAPPTSGLRYKIMENYPYEDILQDVSTVDDLFDAKHSMITMDYYSGAWAYIGLPDPLIMMAVKRPKVLSLLINKNNRKNEEPYDYTRWRSLSYNNPNTGVNAKNMIGKTALHAAIQQNQIESTKVLVNSGADLNSIVDGPLVHNRRTVAMYAAANANLELIRYLVDNGVDFLVADSQGVTPIGYLMGFGMLETNPHLTKENYKKYIAHVDPNLFLPSRSKIKPSFNCDKAGNYAEKTICNHSTLSIFDRVLSTHYNKFYKSNDDKDSVKKSQIKWIKQRNKCRDIECIEIAYQQRIREIQ